MSHPQKKDVGKALKPPRCSIGFLHLRTLTSFQRVGQASFSLFRRTLQSRKRYRHFALQLSLPILQHLIDISQTVRQSRPHCAEVPRTRPSPSAPCCRKKKVSRPCNDRTPSSGRVERPTDRKAFVASNSLMLRKGSRTSTCRPQSIGSSCPKTRSIYRSTARSISRATLVLSRYP